MSSRICVVGAGFTGAVIARELAAAGYPVLLIDERTHLAGHCHTARDPSSGIMMHVYGPHVFHTDDGRVWAYVSRFAEMMPYVSRVKAVAGGRVFSLPINLHTINQFFGKALSPAEACSLIASLVSRIPTPSNFEEQALSMVGADLYRAFFRGYTLKQWGVDPTRLPPSILKRLPLRFSYDDNYFNHKYQGMPRNGYTEMVHRIVDVPDIEIRPRCRFEDLTESFRHIVYTGQIDRYFGFRLGRLGYRTLDFERIEAEGDYQGAAILNYCDEDVPWTRITEHKHLAPWQATRFPSTVCSREYSRDCGSNDVAFYPLRLADDQTRIASYAALARAETGVTFAGRLGTYAYIDMDVAIARALETAQCMIPFLRRGDPPASFFHDPITLAKGPKPEGYKGRE
jgi:UDP-galactopyranose mutase